MILLLFLLLSASAEDCEPLCDCVNDSCTISGLNKSLTCNISQKCGTITIKDSELKFFNSTAARESEMTTTAYFIYQFNLDATRIFIQNSLIHASLIDLSASEEVQIIQSSIKADGAGWYKGYGYCRTVGASYGGKGGGNCIKTCTLNDMIYGNSSRPYDFGSGSADIYRRGGGIIKLETANLTLESSTISSSGNFDGTYNRHYSLEHSERVPMHETLYSFRRMESEMYYDFDSELEDDIELTGGSGGSVWIQSKRIKSSSSQVYAIGGDSIQEAGGGGRIAIYGRVDGKLDYSARGGSSNGTSISCTYTAAAGTVFIGETNTLNVNNNGLFTLNQTPLKVDEDINLSVSDNGIVAPYSNAEGLHAKSISVMNAYVLLNIEEIYGVSLDLTAEEQITISTGGMIGTYSNNSIQLNAPSIDLSSGLIFFSSDLFINATTITMDGTIESNGELSTIDRLFIKASDITFQYDSIIRAGRMAIMADSINNLGYIYTRNTSCIEDIDFYNNSNIYDCDIDNINEFPDLTTLEQILEKSFTIYMQVTNNFKMTDGGRVHGSRIGICSNEINVRGLISATGAGCQMNQGIGRGAVTIDCDQAGGGGYGGKGGGFNNTEGPEYASYNMTYFEGSGGGSCNQVGSAVAGGSGGGYIKIQAKLLDLAGKITADGEECTINHGDDTCGGGSGGSININVQKLSSSGLISAKGNKGDSGGGSGGGGRIYFKWIDKADPAKDWTGDIDACSIYEQKEKAGECGSVISMECNGAYSGPLCEPCPIGYYSEGGYNEKVYPSYTKGSNMKECKECTSKPEHSKYISTSSTSDCEWECDDDYIENDDLDKCMSAIQIVIYAFGGIEATIGTLAGIIVFLSILCTLIHILRKRKSRKKPMTSFNIRRGGGSKYNTDHKQPMSKLEQPELVLEDLPFHECRIYLLGDNSYFKPWALPLVPPDNLKDMVILQEYTKFVDQINALTRWYWREYVIYVLLCIFYYPLGSYWLYNRRKTKYNYLREFIKYYLESLWVRVDMRQISNSLRISCSRCYTLGYIDVITSNRKIEEWDERPDLPMTVIVSGDGSLWRPYRIDYNDIMIQLLEFSLTSSRYFKEFIQIFNKWASGVNLNSAIPEKEQVPLNELKELIDDYNELLFRDCGYVLALCLFQAPLQVEDGQYVPEALSLPNNMMRLYASRLKHESSQKVYTYKLGFIVHDEIAKEPDHSKSELYWLPNMLDDSSEAQMRDYNIRTTRDPKDARSYRHLSFSTLLSSKAYLKHPIIIFLLSNAVLVDLSTTLLITFEFIIEEEELGLGLVFHLLPPFGAIIAPILGIVSII
jgi:hypothetical protein